MNHLLTHSVHEQLRLGGEVVVDNIVQTGNVQTSSCDIGYNQRSHFACLELGSIDLPS